MSTFSADVHPQVNQLPIMPAQQSADPNQVTLQAFQSILAQQLEKQEARLREQFQEQHCELKEELEAKFETKMRQQSEQHAELMEELRQMKMKNSE